MHIHELHPDGTFVFQLTCPSNYTKISYSLDGGNSWSIIPTGNNPYVNITSFSQVIQFKATTGGGTTYYTPSPIVYKKYSKPRPFHTDNSNLIYWYGNKNNYSSVISQGWICYSNSGPKPMNKDFLCELFGLDYNKVDHFANFKWNPDFKPGFNTSAFPISSWFIGWGYSSTPIIAGGTARNHYRRALMCTAYFKKVASTGASSTIYSSKYYVTASTGTLHFYDASHSPKKRIESSTYHSDHNVIINWNIETGFNYSVSNTTYTDFDGNEKNISISNNQDLRDYGTYTLTVEKVNSSDPSANITKSLTIVIEDPDPADPPIIYNRQIPSIIYTDDSKVFVDPQYPTVKCESNCILTSYTLNGQGFNLGQEVSENGLYTVIATCKKKTNDTSATSEGKFEIDNIPPDPPTIIINSTERYQGRDFGVVGKYPNPINVQIKVQNACNAITKVYYRANKREEWKETNWQDIYSTKGEYKIDSYSYKPKNKLYSTSHTIVVFYKKIKYRYNIILNPDKLCYRTEASINFSNDNTLKRQYKIDNGEWMWYREPIKIYKNCTISCRSLDGEDNYESYITTKVVDIIDTEPPLAPNITGVTEGEIATTVIPNVT